MERSSLSFADNSHGLRGHDEWQGQESHGLLVNAGQRPNDRAVSESSISQGCCLLPNCKQADLQGLITLGRALGFCEIWKIAFFRIIQIYCPLEFNSVISSHRLCCSYWSLHALNEIKRKCFLGHTFLISKQIVPEIVTIVIFSIKKTNKSNITQGEKPSHVRRSKCWGFTRSSVSGPAEVSFESPID